MKQKMAHQLSEALFLIKLCSAAFLIVLLSACTLKTEAASINPNPSDEMIIHGSLPADQALDIQMTARFESTNNSCGNAVDISHVYQLSETLKINIEKTVNQYEAHFFRDAIMKGDCDWRLIYVTAELTHKNAGKAWYKFYDFTPEDLEKKYLASNMPDKEDHLLEIKCDVKPSSTSNGSSDKDSKTQNTLDNLECSSRRGMFLMPSIHRYNVNFNYNKNGIF